jgi:single-strand DNA-binding protein
MPGDTQVTMIGNLTGEVELSFTTSGTAVAHFIVASTPRIFDRKTGEWRDGEALFLRCNLWRQAAENAAETLNRGSRVIVVGRLKQRSYETRDGEKRVVIELDVDEIAASLRYATAKLNKLTSESTSALTGGGSNGPTGSADPWESGLPASGGDEAPF